MVRVKIHPYVNLAFETTCKFEIARAEAANLRGLEEMERRVGMAEEWGPMVDGASQGKIRGGGAAVCVERYL